jgi:uncharacterized damage-inducible protein DinB
MTRVELERLFRWDAWANRETLASLRAVEPPTDRGTRLLAHVVGAEWLWLSRLRDEPSPLAVWPSIGLAACAEELDELAREWSALFSRLSPPSLERIVAYTNSKGEPWTSRVEDILLQVPFHSERHRGQIAAEVRACGGEPAYTDYIEAARRGFVT